MGTVLNVYRKLVDDLRELRRKPNWKSTDDSNLMVELESLYQHLTVDEQKTVATEFWRGWPDLYDRTNRKMTKKSEPVFIRMGN